MLQSDVSPRPLRNRYRHTYDAGASGALCVYVGQGTSSTVTASVKSGRVAHCTAYDLAPDSWIHVSEGGLRRTDDPSVGR